MTEVKFHVNIQVNINANRDRAIVRKVLRHPARRYALTAHGRWVFVPEGDTYPEQCILPVIECDMPDTDTVSSFADLQT